MQIEILKLLEKHPNGPALPSEGLTLKEIASLEKQCCVSGRQFQKTLKEFLFLAGKYCSYFDSGVSGKNLMDTQQKIAEILSTIGYTFSYPNIWCFGFEISYDEFFFIDLNQDKDDPDVYSTSLNLNLYETDIASQYVEHSGISLSVFINKYISHYLEKGRPFGY